MPDLANHDPYTSTNFNQVCLEQRVMQYKGGLATGLKSAVLMNVPVLQILQHNAFSLQHNDSVLPPTPSSKSPSTPSMRCWTFMGILCDHEAAESWGQAKSCQHMTKARRETNGVTAGSLQDVALRTNNGSRQAFFFFSPEYYSDYVSQIIAEESFKKKHYV